MKNPVTRLITAGTGLAISCFAASAIALPQKGGISLLKANSPVAEEVHLFHNWLLMPVMTIICIFVLGLLLWTMVRFNEKANPVPNKFSHNTLIEIIWTFIPIVILLIISLPSFELLMKEDKIPDGKQVITELSSQQREFTFINDFNERRTVKKKKHLDVVLVRDGNEKRLAYRKDFSVDGFGDKTLKITLAEPARSGDRVIIRGGRTRIGVEKILNVFGKDQSEVALAPTVTIKATGKQWLWEYSYPEFGDFDFAAIMLPEEETTKELYLFDTNNHVVLPVGETVRLITTASDVIHSWAMPAFAVKVDAVPGRNNETWFKANRTGMYYGQCSEICGKDHAFMPISVKIVTRPEFETWVDQQRDLAGLEPMFSADAVRVAAASKNSIN